MLAPTVLSFLQSFSRRKLFLGAAAAALSQRFGARPAEAAESSGALQIGPKLYESIGVRPMINARGTFTIITGSQSLPEVKQAMLEASKHYVHLDELMEGVGRRLAALTRAEWGIVTNGCAAALTHATAACIAAGLAPPPPLPRDPSKCPWVVRGWGWLASCAGGCRGCRFWRPREGCWHWS